MHAFLLYGVGMKGGVLGSLCLWLAFLVGVWGSLAGVVGGVQGRRDLQHSARRAVLAMCATLVVAVLALEWALFTHDFNVAYVAAHTSRNLPIVYTWSALYAGQEGSLLLWAGVLSLFGSLALPPAASRHRDLMPYVAGVVCAVGAFFVSVMLFADANPFRRLPYTPVDGNGLDPQLQNPGMVFHPPMLYLGLSLITIPFAFAMAALLAKRLDGPWLVAIRRWALLSWLFLSIGICLGMWWAYVEVGWGGYWAWDPVENASLLPWLTMTAFLHSAMMQERRGMLKRWNFALIIGSWLLSIFGTFITRSGVVSSVHAFAQSNAGYAFVFFLIAAGTTSFALYGARLPLLTAEATLESPVSREAGFLFNNLLLVGIACSVLVGTVYPIFAELVRGTKVAVEPPFFTRVNIPLGLALLALMGAGPLIAWRRASIVNLRRQLALPATVGACTVLALLGEGMRESYTVAAMGLGAFFAATRVQEFARGARARHRDYGEGYGLAIGRLLARNRRRCGGSIVHTGIVVLFIAFAGMRFRTETEATLRPGESASLQSPYGRTYTFTHLGISQYDALNRQVTAAAVEVSREGRRVGILTTEQRQHVDGFGRPTFQPSTEVGIMSDPREDVYGVLAGVVGGTEQAVFRFTINPLVWWVWSGGMLVAVGGVIVMWPGGKRGW